jgi:hypothetical protein
MSMAASTRKPILISGAGLSSLLLGQSLLRASIPFLIFERDSSFSTRAQGYRLLLSAEGLDAIESVLGLEKFPQFWDTCGKTGGSGFSVKGPAQGIPAVSRWADCWHFQRRYAETFHVWVRAFCAVVSLCNRL